MQEPNYFGFDTDTSTEDELVFSTHGTSLDFAFEIEEDEDCEEDDYDEGKYEE